MRETSRLLVLALGLLGGVCVTALAWRHGQAVRAGDTDRFEDYALCTGAWSAEWKSTSRWDPSAQAYHWHREAVPIEGVWLLDYRSGKLLGTACDRMAGKIVGWAEVDLVQEFGVAPRQTVHFAMATGTVAPGQAALYITETTTGQLAVYTMQPRPDGAPGVIILRHDKGTFRKPKN
jgi:hypothetical protein